MNNEDGKIWYGIGLDNTELKKQGEEAKRTFISLSDKIQSESKKMDNNFSSLGKSLAAIGGTAAIGMLGKQILDTTAKFEKFGIVLKNTLGDVKGGESLDMIAQFAATTPFQLDEVTGAFIKMANQGFVPTKAEMVKLGDVASSTGKSFDQLTEALLDAQTGQFERLKEFGIKASQNGDKVTFSFKEQKTTVENTNSAIQKYILSLGELKGVQGANALISASLTGQISNLEDKLAAMYNDIGKSNSGFLYAAVGGVSTLIDNYQLVGKILLGLVTTYGAYKTAVILSTAVTNGYTVAQSIEYATLLMVEKAQVALNKSMLLNPYVAAAVAVTALVAGLAIYISTLKEVNQTEISKKTIQDKVNSQYDEQKAKIDALVGVLNNEKVALEQRKSALLEIQKLIPNYHAGLTNEGKLINDNKLAIDDYLKSLEKEIRLQASKDELIELYKKKRLQEKTVSSKEKDATIAEAASNTTIIGEPAYATSSRGMLAGQKRIFANEAKKELQGTIEAIMSVEKELNSEIVTKITPDPEKNKNYWEKQKKNAQEALDLMGFAKRGTKEWNNQVTLYNQATEKLKIWDVTGKVATEVNKKAQEEADASLKIKNNAAKQYLEQRQNEIDNQNSLLSVQEDGFAKQKALIDLNQKQRLLDIDKKEQELIEKEQEAQKLAWEKGGKKGVFIPTTTNGSQLSDTDKKQISDLKTVVSITYTADSDRLVKELSDKYASFDDKRRAIDKKYANDQVAIKAMFKGDELTTKLSELDKQHKDALQSINSDEAETILKTSDLVIQLFDDASTKSVADLRKIAAEAKRMFDYINNTDVKNITERSFGGKTYTKTELTSIKSDPNKMGGLKKQIQDVTNTADQGEVVFGNFGNNIKKMFDGFGKGKNLVGDLQKGMEGLQGTFQSVSFFAGQATSLLNAMSTEEGDAADVASKSIGAVMDVANSTMQGFQQGGYVGAAIAFTMSIATKIFASEKAHQQALKKLQDEKIAQQKEYNDLLIKQNELLDNAVTIFGTDTYSQAVGYAQVADKYRNASNNANSDLSNSTVQTGSHKTGLFGWGGEKADYSSLIKTYPALIDGQGKLNQELAQSVLDNQTLDETSKKALQSALDYSKEYEDALKSLSDYLSGIFGSLGQDMMTAITDNLGNTKSALDEFAGSASKTIEKLMTDIAYSMFFADKFKKLSDQVLDVQKNVGLTPQQQAAQEEALLAQFYSNIGTDVTSANKFLQDSKDAAAKAGFDIWDTTNSREASQKGFASMSQDSANELNGRFTAIQGHTFSINENVKMLQINSSQALKHLAGIETNTSRLEAIENNMISVNKTMASVKHGIDDINMKGIYLKM